MGLHGLLQGELYLYVLYYCAEANWVHLRTALNVFLMTATASNPTGNLLDM
jgi:hypothetical protein